MFGVEEINSGSPMVVRELGVQAVLQVVCIASHIVMGGVLVEKKS